MSLTPRMIRLPWVAGLAFAVVAAIGVGQLFTTPTGVGGQVPGPSLDRTGQGVVCLGKVDVESGILALAPLQPGAIVEIPCYEGQKVSEGEPLLRVNTEPFIGHVAEAKAGIRMAEAKMVQAQQALEQHKEGLKGKQALIDIAKAKLGGAQTDLRTAEKAMEFHNSPLTAEDLTKAKQQVEGAKAGVTAAEADLESFRKAEPRSLITQAATAIEVQKAKLDQANEQVKRCTLRAPKDGVVLQMLASVGSQFGPQSHQPALYFAPDGPRVIRAEVAQEFASRISLGAAATIHDESSVGPALHGKVLWISDAFLPPKNTITHDIMSTSSNNTVLEVRVSIDLPANGVMPKLQQRMRVTIEGAGRR